MKKKTIITEALIYLFVFTGLLIAAMNTEIFVPSGFKEELFKSKPIERRDNMYGVTHVGEKLFWIAGNIGKIVRSRDGGHSWESLDSGIRSNLQDISAWDEKRLVSVGNEGVLIVSYDGGDTWMKKEIPLSVVANKLIRVKTFAGGKAWACGIMGMVLYSDDYGKTWKRRTPEEDAAYNDIVFPTDLIGVIVCEFGKILRTDNGGDSWTEIETSVDKTLMAVDIDEKGIGVAVGLEGTALRTVDFGLTWQLIDAGTDQHLFNVSHYNGHWIGVGNKGVITSSLDSGISWHAQKLSDNELLWHTDISRVSSAKMIIVGGSQGLYENEKWEYLF